MSWLGWIDVWRGIGNRPLVRLAINGWRCLKNYEGEECHTMQSPPTPVPALLSRPLRATSPRRRPWSRAWAGTLSGLWVIRHESTIVFLMNICLWWRLSSKRFFLQRKHDFSYVFLIFVAKMIFSRKNVIFWCQNNLSDDFLAKICFSWQKCNFREKYDFWCQNHFFDDFRAKMCFLKDFTKKFKIYVKSKILHRKICFFEIFMNKCVFSMIFIKKCEFC